MTGDAFVTGYTASADFPVTLSTFQPGPQGASDAFVAKFPLGAPQLLSVSGITPAEAGNLGTVRPRLVGGGFHNGAVVKLVGAVTIFGNSTEVGSEGRTVDSTFNLSGVPSGAYDVIVSNQDGSSASLAHVFTVQQGGTPKLWVSMAGRHSFHPGRPSTVSINFGNKGNVDVYDVVMLVHLPPGVQYSISELEPVDDPFPGLDQLGFNTASDIVVPLWIYKIPAGSGSSLFLSVTAASGSLSLPLEVDLLEPPLTGFALSGNFSSIPFNLDLAAQAIAVAIVQRLGLVSSSNSSPLSITSAASRSAASRIGGCGPGSSPQCDPIYVQAHDAALANLVSNTGKHLEDSLSLELLIEAAALAAGAGLIGTGAVVAIAIGIAALIVLPFLAVLYDAVTKTNLVTDLGSIDPNEKDGPLGIGSGRYVSGSTPLTYSIFFENVPRATAPAQEIVITDPLCSNIDMNSVQPTGIVLAGQRVPLPLTFLPKANLTDVSTILDLRPSQKLLVIVHAKLDLAGRLLTWTFRSIDPQTGLPPIDPTVGLLAPGAEGSVFFTVAPANGLVTNAQLQNQATVVFDSNAPIATAIWVNTVDNTTPTSQVLSLPANESSTSFTVPWTGTDVGAGIQDFTIYVSDNGGPFTAFQTNTTATSATFSGQVGHTYGFYSIARDLVGNVEGVKSLAEATTQVIQGVTDTTPPVTAASAFPSPNANGWNNTDVSVTLNSADSELGGTGVKQITYSATGANVIPNTVASGASASLIIIAEGITTITFFGTDNAGNIETAKTVTVKLDKTPPSIAGLRSPPPNLKGWNNTNVTVSFTCADSLSGLALGSPPAPTTLSTEGAGQSVSGACQDLAGNSAAATVGGINIDKTPPILTVTTMPPPNASGWNNSNVTVSFAAVDTLSGVGVVSAPVTVTAEGAGQVVTGSATDLAGNLATGSVTINVDKTPPEAFIQFDPVKRDVVLFGRDSLSGVPPGPASPISVQLLRNGDRDNDERKDGRSTQDGEEPLVEIRTYKVLDLAGNSLVLVAKVWKQEHRLSAEILSLQYNGGPALALAQNEEVFEWELEKGRLEELEQQFSVGPGGESPRVEAEFGAEPNQTTIRREEPKIKVLKPGLDLLRMATTAGKLSIEF